MLALARILLIAAAFAGGGAAAPAALADDKADALAALLRAYEADGGDVDNLLQLRYAFNDAALQSAMQGLSADALPTFGAGDVVVYEFSDYQCGFCRRMFAPLAAAAQAGDATIALIEFPILGEMSDKAARYALAAHTQGRFELFHRRLMQSERRLTEDFLQQAAENAGLDMQRLRQDIDSPAIDERIEQNYKLAVLFGVSGTPALIINGQLYKGALDKDDFARVLQQAKQKDDNS